MFVFIFNDEIIFNQIWNIIPIRIGYSGIVKSPTTWNIKIRVLVERGANNYCSIVQLVWLHSTNGDLSSKQAYAFLHPSAVALPWASLIWRACIPPSQSFIFWCLMHDKMPNDDNIRKCGCTVVSVCVLCMTNFETSTHLLECPFASHL